MMVYDSFYKVFQDFKWEPDPGMIIDLKAFLEGSEEISKYDMTKDQEGKVIIHVKLHTFSRRTSTDFFINFLDFVGYDDGVNFYICERAETEVRYLYLTQVDTLGAKMKIVIS